MYIGMFAGAMMCFMDTPARRCMNITATVLLAFLVCRWMHLLHQSVKVPPSINRNFLKHCERPYFGAVETLTPLIGWGMGVSQPVCP